MKNRITSCHTLLLCAVLAICLLFAGCTATPPTGTEPGMPAPSILLNGQAYYAPHMPVYELPEGYEYVGTLSQEADNGTGLAGSKMYMDPSQDPEADY